MDIPKKPTKTVQSANGKVMLHQEIEFMIFKTINGSTTYSVEILSEGLSEEAIHIAKETVLNHVKIHGCFDPNDK